MRISYDNWFDDYTPTISSENGSYLGVNVQDSRLSRVWKTTSLSSQSALIDATSGATLAPTFAAMLATNLTTGGTYTIQGSSVSNFASSTSATLTRIDSDFIGAFFTLSAKRYWRFVIKDTGSTYGYMQVGRLWLSNYITPENGIEMEFPEEYIDTSEYMVSRSGQMYGDVGVERRSYNIKFPLLSSSGKAAFQTFLSSVKKAKNFITVFSATNMSKIKPLYGFKSSDHAYKHLSFYRWGCQFKIEESK